MSLPVIATPLYELVLPSTGKKYKYRPFLVKEEKILLMALEGGNTNEIINAITEIIKVCVKGIDTEKIAIFDLEYIFLRLREKSIGEEISLYVRHINGINSKGVGCDQSQEIKVNLTGVDILKDPEHKNKIQLTDSIGVVMKYPTIALMEEVGEFNASSAFSIIERCIDYIYDNDKTYPVSECGPNELKEFIDSLSHTQFEKIEKFFSTLPKLRHESKWICKKCGVEETIVLEGLNDFFT
jgi:hypothetical protein